MTDLNDMVLFVQVARARSFSQAAAVSGVPKSTLSRRIAQLEVRLGVRLLERNSRQVQLTEAGQRYLEGAEAIVARAEAIEREVAQLSAEPRGNLRVSASPQFGHTYLGPLIVDYLARYPETTVELGLTYRPVDMVAEGIDLAFRFGPISDHELIARRLGAAPRVWCASPAYLHAHGPLASPHELVDHACIAHGVTQARGEWSFHGPQGELRVHVRGRLSVRSAEIALLAAEAGLGIARLPLAICDASLQAGRLVRVLQGWEPSDVALFAVYPSREHLSAKVRAFLDLAIERFGEQAPWDPSHARAE